jgi:hypothetical protein
LLEIGQGEGHLFMLDCWRIDRQAFLAAGGTVRTGLPPGDRCVLDKVADPVALLRSIATQPVGAEQRYVPVR